MKKKRILLLAIGMCLLGSMQVLAAESNAASDYIATFAQELAAQDDNYALWEGAIPRYGYELYGQDFETPVGDLYYLTAESRDVGYAIVNDQGTAVLEFSNGLPAYDMLKDEKGDAERKYLYVGAMPAVYRNGVYSDLTLSGEPLQYYDVESGVAPRYNPNIQGGNCIVGAVSNLMWHWSNNVYSSLASGMTFQDVESAIDTLILAEGGYANANIPNTIKKYVKNKNSSYSATVTNKNSPTFSAVKTETGSRPCLLGFAAGSPYSSTVGHMTVCVGTRTVNGVNYSKVMDGWSTSVVEKQWGTYNDFMSKVTLSK